MRDHSGEGLFTTEKTAWAYAGVIVVALAALILLRHSFGSIRVDVGARG